MRVAHKHNERVTLVTGATGFVGRAVALRLLELGVAVRAMVRDPQGAKQLADAGAELAVADMRDPNSIEGAIRGVHSVVHCAAVIGKRNEPRAEFYTVNVEGTRRLGLCAVANGVDRFVTMSSIAVFGLEPGTDTSETSPRANSGFAYTDSMVAQDRTIDRMARLTGLPAITLYPTQIYGPGDTGWTGLPLSLIRTGRMALADGGRGIIQPVFIDDVAEAVVLALDLGRVGEGYIIAGPAIVTTSEFFGRLAQMVGRNELRALPKWILLAQAAAREAVARVIGRTPAFNRLAVLAGTRTSTYDGTRAREELGFVPRFGLDEGMRRVEATLRSESGPE